MNVFKKQGISDLFMSTLPAATVLLTENCFASKLQC